MQEQPHRIDLFTETEFLGPPRNWKRIEDQSQRDDLSIINPNYGAAGYDDNCVNCVLAYDLRQRDFNVTAKSSVECKIGRKIDKLWEGSENRKQNCISLAELEKIISLTEDSRYFIGLMFQGKFNYRFGHAIILDINNGNFSYLDVQRGAIFDEKYYGKIIEVTFWRIDDLVVTQTGYNACMEVK